MAEYTGMALCSAVDAQVQVYSELCIHGYDEHPQQGSILGSVDTY